MNTNLTRDEVEQAVSRLRIEDLGLSECVLNHAE